jgi:broad specificity phosphatase PhoE
MITIIFEAHSTTIDNEAKKASGWNDIDLSNLGIRQSQELKDRYLDKQIDAIFPSDLQRAVKTAVPLAAEKHIPIYPDKRLRECDYGDLTQAPKAEVGAQKAKRIDAPFPNGESYQDCISRMRDFLEWLKDNFDGKTVIIVGHRATQYGLEHLINGKDLLTCVTEPWTYQPGWEYKLD